MGAFAEVAPVPEAGMPRDQEAVVPVGLQHVYTLTGDTRTVVDTNTLSLYFHQRSVCVYIY